MKVSISTCAFGGLDIEDPVNLVEYCAKSKYRHMDLSFNNYQHIEDHIRTFSEVRETAEKLGIDFCMSHAPYRLNPSESEEKFDLQVNAMRKALESASILGIDRMTVHGGFAFCDEREQMFENNVKYFNAILPYAEKYNIALMIENISEEIVKRKFILEDADDLVKLKGMLNNHPLIKYCWDTGHANTKGLDQYSNIIKLGKDLWALHLQDNNGYNDDHMPMLMGTVNFDEVLKALVDVEYSGPFNFEARLFPGGNVWPNFRHKHTEASGAKSLLFDPDERLKLYSLDVMHDIALYALNKYNIEVE